MPLRSIAVIAVNILTLSVLIGIIYRYEHSGQVCSGDYLQEKDSKAGHMITAGLMLAVCMYVWIALFIVGCCIGVFAICLAST